MTTEEIHEQGAKRHGAEWACANQRAVNAMTGTEIKPWDRGMKDVISLVVLRILDGVRFDSGYQWLDGATEWTLARGRGLATAASKDSDGKAEQVKR